MKQSFLYSTGLLLSLLCVLAVYYWELRYLSASGVDGANELLVGSALVMTYTWPVWLRFPVFAILFRRHLDSRRVYLALLPAFAILAPVLIRSSNYAF